MNSPFFCPPRLALAKGRLNTESRRLLELYLQGDEVSRIASLYGMGRDAMACSLTSLVIQVRHLLRQMPSDSGEWN